MFRLMASSVTRIHLGSGISHHIRTLSTSKATEVTIAQPPEELAVPVVKAGGFARAFEKYTNIQHEEIPKENQNFATMLRNCKLMDLGDPEGKIVIGKIFHIVGDDLYIDFGWKFHCVCTRPSKKGDEYVRGARVRVEVRDLELSSRFIGSDTDLTLLEADCRLLGLISSPLRPTVEENS